MGCCPSKSVLLEDNSCFYYDWAIAQASNSLIEVHIPEFVLQRNNGQSEINDALIDEDLDKTKDVKSSDDFEETIAKSKEATIAELKRLFEKRKNDVNNEELKDEIAKVKTNDARTQFLNSQLFSATAQTVCDPNVQDISKESEKDSSKANNETLRRSSRKDSFMNKILVYYFRPKTGK